MRSVAQTHHVSLSTVQRWVQRAGTRRLDRIDWSARSHATQTRRRVSEELERLVITLRHELRTTSDLGDYGVLLPRQAPRGGSAGRPKKCV